MRDTTKFRITEHSLLYKALEHLKPLLESIDPAVMALPSSKERHSKAPKLSEAQNYHHRVFWYAKNMNETFKRLKDITLFIKDFPKPRTYFRQGITEHDWIQYHYHVYTIGVVGIYDIALKLTNEVFRLGIEERQVRKDTVEDNLWVKRTRVSQLLSILRKSTRPFKVPRNLFLHGGDQLKLDELDRLELICIATKLQVTDEHSPNLIKNIFQPSVDKLVNKMSKQISSLENKTANLFDELLPIYNFWSSYLKNADT